MSKEKMARAKIIAKKMLNSGKSIVQIVQQVQKPEYDAPLQLLILDAFNAVAQEQGRYAGGTPTLGDEILGKQSCRVKRYGKKAYKLSDKQVSVIIREVYGYRKTGNSI